MIDSFGELDDRLSLEELVWARQAALDDFNGRLGTSLCLDDFESVVEELERLRWIPISSLPAHTSKFETRFPDGSLEEALVLRFAESIGAFVDQQMEPILKAFSKAAHRVQERLVAEEKWLKEQLVLAIRGRRPTSERAWVPLLSQVAESYSELAHEAFQPLLKEARSWGEPFVQGYDERKGTFRTRLQPRGAREIVCRVPFAVLVAPLLLPELTENTLEERQERRRITSPEEQTEVAKQAWLKTCEAIALLWIAADVRRPGGRDLRTALANAAAEVSSVLRGARLSVPNESTPL